VILIFKSHHQANFPKCEICSLLEAYLFLLRTSVICSSDDSHWMDLAHCIISLLSAQYREVVGTISIFEAIQHASPSLPSCRIVNLTIVSLTE
jgi:hypothetical protein